jgi:hypothetical protein
LVQEKKQGEKTCDKREQEQQHNNNNNNNNNNKDIITRDNEKGTCMLIDVAIPGDRNVIKKEAKRF